MAEQPATSGPPSPGVSPVDLSDCIEDLLHFTLSTYLQELPFDLGFSKDYCSRLLQHDEVQPLRNLNTRDRGGVPVYPLYKHLARSLERSIKLGTLSRYRHPIESIPVDESVKEKEKRWNELIVEKGSEILNMLESVDFEMHVQEPFLSQLRAGLKTVEGRCAVGNYNRVAPGDLLLFNKCLLLKVQHVNRYISFSEMLKFESLPNVLPGVKTIEEGVQIYRNFYTEEKEISNGVLAISVYKLAFQPYISLASLLSVNWPFRFYGEASRLPVEENWPQVVKCLMSDSAKNKLASEVINRLLDGCCWMNLYFIKPQECVFEIRVREGYGARWSADGTKFIGFLEPYSEEGYSKGWKH